MPAARRRGPAAGDSGIALLVVLLTIALLTIVVVEFTHSAQVETHFALGMRNGLQAHYLARSGVNIAEAILGRDKSAVDSDEDVWARPLPPLPVGDGTVALRIRDEARALNLNGMLRAGSVPVERLKVFARLFDVLGIDQPILAAIVDWIDANQDPTAFPAAGAEQPSYLGLAPPIAVRNAPLLTLRELLQVRGVTPTILSRLEGLVTVLPLEPPDEPLRINVNTAPAEVLYALSDGLSADPGIVDRLLAMRREQPFRGDEWKAVPGFEAALGSEARAYVGVSSKHFRIEAVGTVGDVSRGIVTVVKRAGSRLTRITWAPSVASLSLTSHPPSDFLTTLPPLAGG